MNKPDATELYNRLPVAAKPENIQDVLDYWTSILNAENVDEIIRFRVFEGQGYLVEVWDKERRYIVSELYRKMELPILGLVFSWDDLEMVEWAIASFLDRRRHMGEVHDGQE